MYTADDSTEILEPDETLASAGASPDSCKERRAHDSRTMPLSSTRSRTLIRSSVLATRGRIVLIRMPARGPEVHDSLPTGVKALDTFFISFNCHRATIAERLLNSCPGTAQRNALSARMNRAALFFPLLCFFHLHPRLERRQFKISGCFPQRFPHPAPHLPGNDPG